jgi:glutamate N-acetyltransferase / amino-acid N-acetyltransferase
MAGEVSSIQVPRGFRFAGVAAGLKKNGADDLALVASDYACSAAATFTQNRFPAAPVLYDRALLAENPGGLRAVAINAGIANACTGEPGQSDALAMAAAAERALGLDRGTCAVMSTGVIGPRLPLDKLDDGLQRAAAQLSISGWQTAAQAIMTTDTRPKTAFRRAGSATLFGMAKGAGMIHPNMATMLALLVTDAEFEPEALQAMLAAAVDFSFNCITVDGDTSTNDTVLLLANGAAGRVEPGLFGPALADLCTDLAQQIVRDGEGASKFIAVRVEGTASPSDARRAAKAIANSPLVKTAFYGGDANWGRILAAVGYSGADVDPTRVDLFIMAGAEQLSAGLRETGPKPLQLVRNGQPLDYSEATAGAIFAGPEITVIVQLGLGHNAATIWTCDLSHDYVDINGHYRT